MVPMSPWILRPMLCVPIYSDNLYIGDIRVLRNMVAHEKQGIDEENKILRIQENKHQLVPPTYCSRNDIRLIWLKISVWSGVRFAFCSSDLVTYGWEMKYSGGKTGRSKSRRGSSFRQVRQPAKPDYDMHLRQSANVDFGETFWFLLNF